MFFKQCTVPTMFTSLPLIRDICIREQIDILHGHGVSNHGDKCLGYALVNRPSLHSAMKQFFMLVLSVLRLCSLIIPYLDLRIIVA